MDIRLARALAGVDADARARRRPDLEDQARPHGHEPRHARADRARERLRDAARHLERPDDHGHRPRRLGAALHRPAAGEGRRVRGGARDDQAVHERQGGQLEREGPPAEVGAPGAARDRDARRRLRAEGARSRRPAGRRRDHPARRPGHHPVDHGHGPPGSRGSGPRPGGAQVHRQRARVTSATISPTRANRCGGSRPWSRTTSRI